MKGEARVIGLSNRSISIIAVVLALSAGISRLPAQERPEEAPRAFAGCYELTVGPWSRDLAADAPYHEVPRNVYLDTLSAGRGGWRLRPDIEYPYGNAFPGTPRWTVIGNKLELIWSNGYAPTYVALVREKDGIFRGEATARSDVHLLPERPSPTASVSARHVRCPPGEAR
jgi:hypothetical protein